MLSRDDLTTAIVCAQRIDAMRKPPEHELNRRMPETYRRRNRSPQQRRGARAPQNVQRVWRESNENDDVVGSAEAAKMLRTSLRTVQRKAHSGELDSEIVGGSLLVFKRAAVEDYRRSNTTHE